MRMKKPAFGVICDDSARQFLSGVPGAARPLTRADTRSVHGEVEIVGDEFASTAGGTRLHSRYARLRPSMRESGSSVLRDMSGTFGIRSTRACMRIYSNGTTPESMNDGVWPSHGAGDTAPFQQHMGKASSRN